MKWAGGGFLSTVGDLLQFGNAMLYSSQFEDKSCGAKIRESPNGANIGVKSGANIKDRSSDKIEEKSDANIKENLSDSNNTVNSSIKVRVHSRFWFQSEPTKFEHIYNQLKKS